MSYDTYISTTNKSGGATNRPHIPVRVQEMKEMEASWYGGAQPYDRFWIHTTDGGKYLFVRGDLIQDEYVIDPVSGQLTTYRVVGNPRNQDNAYYAVPVDRYVSSRTDGH